MQTTQVETKHPWPLGRLILVMLVLTGCGRWQQLLCLPGPESELLLRDAMAGAGPSKLKETKAEPLREELSFSIAGRAYKADLYRPADAQAALMLLPGTTTDGKRDPRMVNFARSLARSRFNVLVPELENLKALRITPGEIGEIGDAFEYLAGRQDLAPGGRAGIAAVSYIVGPALLAAAEPRIRDKVRYIFSLGGYYDLENVLTYVTTGRYRSPGGRWRYREPNAHGKWVLVLSNASRIPDPRDQATLAEIARLKIADPEAPIADISGRMVSAEGKALIALMSNRDPERVPALIAQLPAGVRADLDALNLRKRDLSGLRARVHLLHGYGDSLIPYTESEALDRVLPSEHSLCLAQGLGHVEFSEEPAWNDAWSLACATEALLKERSR